MEVDEIKERQRSLWALSDYSELSESLRPAARALRRLRVSAGQEVLDVAAGDGNFALACARGGRERGGLRPRARHGRARPRALGRPRATTSSGWRPTPRSCPSRTTASTASGSVFGAMIAPRPERGGAGAVPGGAPGQHGGHDGLDAGQLHLGAVPARPPLRAAAGGLPLPEEWADEETVRERFEGLAGDDRVRDAARSPGGRLARGVVAEIERRAPRLGRRAGATCRPSATRQMRAEIARARAQLGGGDGPVRIEHEYALIVARRRG